MAYLTAVSDPSAYTRRVLLQSVAAAALTTGLPARPALCGTRPAAFLRGVALAGAEFGQLIPGQLGRDYIYPRPADFKFCVSQGFNVARLPFKWDRLQPDTGKPFDDGEWNELSTAIQNAKLAGLSLILDPHNYSRRRVREDDYSAEHLIGSAQVPVAAFTAFWQELARRAKSETHLIFGLMNEPVDIAADTWLGIVNQTLSAIRETSARQLILVPGVAYTGAHSWYAAGNTVLTGVRDPADNFAVEVHQYLDEDSSGRSAKAISATIGSERLQAFQNWARDNKLKAFLGEFGAGSDAASLKALENTVREVESNTDVWIGWTAWGAGPWWPDDEPLRLSTSSTGQIPPQTKLLSAFARSGR